MRNNLIILCVGDTERMSKPAMFINKGKRVTKLYSMLCFSVTIICYFILFTLGPICLFIVSLHGEVEKMRYDHPIRYLKEKKVYYLVIHQLLHGHVLNIRHSIELLCNNILVILFHSVFIEPLYWIETCCDESRTSEFKGIN